MKNFENCKNVVFRVEAKPFAGALLTDAIKECIKFAKATKCEVYMKFNCVNLWIRDYHTVDAIKKCYDECYDEKIEKAIKKSDK